ncbi:MAG: hypothetical protein A3J83_04785 [Elusimicrobia bacterium RIFOXYA2_FULL_40_6]|nr:MAG: hypothetical protein A3J83_04785 [Elusimicrobia bacterium RIFOXYA2_FULL_40_6]
MRSWIDVPVNTAFIEAADQSRRTLFEFEKSNLPTYWIFSLSASIVTEEYKKEAEKNKQVKTNASLFISINSPDPSFKTPILPFN